MGSASQVVVVNFLLLPAPDAYMQQRQWLWSQIYKNTPSILCAITQISIFKILQKCRGIQRWQCQKPRKLHVLQVQRWYCAGKKRYTNYPIPTSFFHAQCCVSVISEHSLRKDVTNMYRRCRDGATCICVLFVCPVFPAQCHLYTQFLWSLALLFLHPFTFLENYFYTA